MKRKLCKLCNKRTVTSNGKSASGKQTFKTMCWKCKPNAKLHVKRRRKIVELRRFPWKNVKRSKCEECGFIPIHVCQLDVDHIDGNKTNNAFSNLKVLCANCHRLKTFINKDWEKVA